MQIKRIAYAALFAVLLAFTSCGGGAKKELGKLLVELADQDQTIDYRDWQRLTEWLDGQKAHFADFYKDGALDEEALRNYISDYFEHRRPPKLIRFIGVGNQLTFNIYVERSGSMTAYDSKQGDGSFQATIMALLNALPEGTRVDSIGEKGYTDFKAIFDQLLNKTSYGTVSLLVTDMIYSTKQMEGVNPQRVFAEMQEMINYVFKGSVKNKSVLMVKLNGSYNGPYYAYNNSVVQYNGQRPYYIIMIGANDAIEHIASDPQLSTFAEMQQLRGYENMYLFTAQPFYHPYYSLLLSHKDVRGRFKPEHGQGYQIKSLKEVEADKNSGDVQLVLAVDLGKMLIDQRYLTDKNNYIVSADDDVKIKEIREIAKADITPQQQKYLGDATHLFVLSLPRVSHEQTVKITLRNELPAWIQASSTDNDLQPDANTTFGLRYLMEGIYRSYKRNTHNAPAYFDIEIKLDK